MAKKEKSFNKHRKDQKKYIFKFINNFSFR